MKSVEVVQDDVLSLPSELERLFRDHYRELSRLALVLTGNPQVAEDLAQEAFLGLGRQARWPRPGAEAAYLRRTVVNLSRSYHRRRAVALRRGRSEGDDAGDLTGTTAMARARDEQIAAAVRCLPRRQRDCVALHYFAGLPEREVAAALSTTVGSVKSSLHRARLTLAKKLEDLR